MNSTPITANATTMAGSESQRAAILDSYGYLASPAPGSRFCLCHARLAETDDNGNRRRGRFFRLAWDHAPELVAIAVTAVELVGGIALMLGIGTRVVGALLAADMLGALLLVHLGNGLFVDAGGFEFVLILLAFSLFFALAGPGPLAVDAYLWKRK